ncbi:MAG: carboxypeptidase regulatory-like domain-containing protein [Candidatus Aminicenantes bacterium]|nr:carboxypeptidase regulatory-like domain-containing protein [Candidatus Aminicenantes bacterium]
MLRKRFYHSPLFVGITIVSFMFLLLPLESLARPAAPSGAIVGFVYGSDMKTPVQNAVVKIRNVDDGKEYVSTPTDATGAYKIDQVKEGKYILGVSAPNGDYNFQYVLMVKGGDIGKLSLALKTGEVTSLGQEGQKAPETEKVSFFRTPVGVAVLMVATTVALYGTFKLLEGKEEASPSKK